MTLEQFDELNYVINDGQIISWNMTFETATKANSVNIIVSIRKMISKSKYQTCMLEIQLNEVQQIVVNSDCVDSGNFSDAIIVKLKNNTFYICFDPYDNSGIPHEDDNFKFISKALEILERF